MNENITLCDDEFTEEPVLTLIDRFACEFSWATIKVRFLCISLSLSLWLLCFLPDGHCFYGALKGNITNSTAFRRQQTSIETSGHSSVSRYRFPEELRRSPIVLSILDTDVSIFVSIILCLCLSLSLAAFVRSVFSNVLIFLANVFRCFENGAGNFSVFSLELKADFLDI